MMTKWAQLLVVVGLYTAGCELPHECFEFDYDEALNQCVCPQGSVPDSDRNGCVYPDGRVLPWRDLDVPYARNDAGQDAGSDAPDASGMHDVGLADAGNDSSITDDTGPMDAGTDTPDAGNDSGVPPGPTQARFPWNGFATGSVHVRADSAIVAHPLRPKLMWETVPDASEYHVQMTRECSVDTFRTCTFDSPELDEMTTETTFRPSTVLPVATAVPVGSRYYWRVQSCSSIGCSEWTVIRYLDVGKLNSDFNGDGYADLLVGAFAQSSPEQYEGNAFLFWGGPTGPSDEPDITFDNPTNNESAFFGGAVAAIGDVNGDGFSDLAIGAAQQSAPEANEGNVFVYYGSATGPSTTPNISLDHPSDQTGGGFGSSLAGGDLNSDGYADLCVGAPFGVSDEEGGDTFIFFGGSMGITARPHISLHNPEDTNGAFGSSATANGDINGDGIVDLIVGASRQNNVFVYFGSPAGPAAVPDYSLGDPDVGFPFFGDALTANDLTGNGYADIVVGAPLQSSPERAEGAVFIYLGSREGPAETPDLTIDNPEDRAEGWFGSAVTSADLNGDGRLDLLVSARQQGHPVPRGKVFVFFGSTVLTEMPNVMLENPSDRGGRFGSALGGGDTNGDGYSDLAVGDSYQNAPETDEGSAFVYLGSRAGPSTTPSISIDNPADQAGGKFGNALAL